MSCLLYGAGLRVLECCRLRVQDIDVATMNCTHVLNRGPAAVRSPADRMVYAVTWPAASHGISSGIGCRASQPTPAWESRSVQAQPAEPKGQQVAAMDSVTLAIGCRISHALPCYADQPIQWPNSS